MTGGRRMPVTTPNLPYLDPLSLPNLPVIALVPSLIHQNDRAVAPLPLPHPSPPPPPTPFQPPSPFVPLRPRSPSRSDRSSRRSDKDDRFYPTWDRFLGRKSSSQSKCGTSPPENGRKNERETHRTEGKVTSDNAISSYEEACTMCKKKVEAIVAECKRLNKKYFDPSFDFATNDPFLSLNSPVIPISLSPAMNAAGCVKRVEDIFEEPKFMLSGSAISNVRQGSANDCWFLAAITALSGTENLPEIERLLTRLCVARNEAVGVYGFVFYRDGEWISEVVDDRLCLKARDDEKQYVVRIRGDKQNIYQASKADCWQVPLRNNLKDYVYKGSDALYFAACQNSDETWLPLIEKAYAKAHGDYQAIEAGITGEAIEDLTGGVNSSIKSEEILDKDIFWTELLSVNKSFLFGCSSRRAFQAQSTDDDGFVRSHAYTILAAREVTRQSKDTVQKLRLLKLRNPWGRQEWNGAWSDGSKEWTPEIMKELDHSFGDDGVFWMSYKDFLRYLPDIDRTRLFGREWRVTQKWASINVPRIVQYLPNRFSLDVTCHGPVVIVLSQPDTRYFRGLEGRYDYDLHFRLYRKGEDTYLVRSMRGSGSGRSASVELDLEPGSYVISLKIKATRNELAATADEVIHRCRLPPKDEKLLAIGQRFDWSHSKGQLREKERADTEAFESEQRKYRKNKQSAKSRSMRELVRKARERERLRRKRIEDAQEKTRGRGMRNQRAQEHGRSREMTARDRANEDAKTPIPKRDQDSSGLRRESDVSLDVSANHHELLASEHGTEMEEATEQPEKDETKKPKTKRSLMPTERRDLNEGNLCSTRHDVRASNTDLDYESDAISIVSNLADDDFSWDSAMDGPAGSLPNDSNSEESDSDSEFEDKTWNATLVVGLRVYSTCEARVELLEHGPRTEEEEEEEA